MCLRPLLTLQLEVLTLMCSTQSKQEWMQRIQLPPESTRPRVLPQTHTFKPLFPPGKLTGR